MVSVENMARLPKWAQRRIELLEMRVREKTQQIEKYYSDKPSRIRIKRYGEDGAKDFNLPDNESITFVLVKRVGDKTREFEVRVCIINNGRSLRVNANGPLTVEPCASNDIVVDERKWD